MELISWAGVPVNGTAPIMMRFRYGTRDPYTADVTLRQVIGGTPRVEGASYGELRQAFIVFPPKGTHSNLRALNEEVNALFDPERGEQELRALRDPADPTSEVVVRARVVDFGRQEDNLWVGHLLMADPIWQTPDPITTGPGTITLPSTSRRVRPILTFTGGTAVNRYHVSVTDTAGRGLSGQPVPIPLGEGWTPADLMVFQALRPVPFFLDSDRGLLWVRIDTDETGMSQLDIYHGDAVQNTVTAQALDLGTLDPLQSTATEWVYPLAKLRQANRAHGGTGSFVANRAVTPNRGYTFGWDSDGSGEGMLRVSPDQWGGGGSPQPLPNDYDALTLVTGVPATRVYVAATAEGVESEVDETQKWVGEGIVYLRTRYPGEEIWQTSRVWQWYGWTKQTVEGWIETPGRVQVALAIAGNIVRRQVQSTGRIIEQRAWGYLRFTGDWRVELDPATVPLVTVSGPIAAQRLDAVVRNVTSGDFVQLVENYIDSDAILTIDPEAGEFATDIGPWHGREMRMQDDVNIFRLRPGPNEITAQGATVTLTYRPGWAL